MGDVLGPSGADPWEALHYWEWFRREQWLSTFRDGKRSITETVAALLRQRGCVQGTVLDSSCGLGLHTIAFHERGFRVRGADRSTFAVSRAAELARMAGHSIPFFASTWHELPARTEERFDVIFCDALSWIGTRAEFEGALEGFRAVLRPRGILLFLGAPEGASPGRGRQLLFERWGSAPRHSLDWHYAEGAVACTKLSCAQLGDDFLDRHHLFLIEETGARRLESVTIRESVHWNWDRLVELFSNAGFRDLHTHAVQQWSSRGISAGLNVASVP